MAKRVMAVASAGGHWVQLFRMRPAWAGEQAIYVTTDPGFEAEVMADAAERGEPTPLYCPVPDASMWAKLALLHQALSVAWLVLRHRPQAIVTTGASVGYFALRIGRLIGARTVWVDSIANAEELSLSGLKAGPHADLWLTQWAHLAAGGSGAGPEHKGAVL